MRVKTHRQYDKTWAKLTLAQQAKVESALELFINDSSHPRLRIHQLKGKYYPQFSFSAGGDLRVHYLQIDADTIILVLVGTHSQLY